jgi:hypothetical protein
MELTDEEYDAYLAHYGVLRRSGRYPWGSGDNVDWSNADFKAYVKDMRRQGLSDTEIAKGVGMNTTELRAVTSLVNAEMKQAQIKQAWDLKNKGMSDAAAARQMGIPGTTYRSLLAPGEKEKAENVKTIANVLKAHVDEHEFTDVGRGVENHLGVSNQKLKIALAMLKEDGYNVYNVPIRQIQSGHDTNTKVLTIPGNTQRDVFLNKDKIRVPNVHSTDGGRTFDGVQPPLSISLDRVGIVYGKKGAEKDGVMYLRPGVPDISLGSSNYAQVRVAVNKTHYLKGMAMYSNKMPDGVDILFHTNKKDTGNKLDALKPMERTSDGKIDTNNPFGAVIKAGGQIITRDRNGKPHVTSAMNIINEEGDWGRWSKNIASQVLSKQVPSLAKEQLAKARKAKEDEFDEIMKLTNPAVKKKLLEEFADNADKAAVHLKAAPLPNQRIHAILPIVSLPDNKVYAPNYKDGETVVLIRYPHAGRFEIPQLTVDNNHRESKALLGQARDAIGIHPKVAERLSGADFDGDFVMVIPNNHGKIKIAPALEGLKNFDPKAAYPKYDGMRVMTEKQKAREMGDISNLITDMTIKKASPEELARADRHSMVVIDAVKHELNYKLSAEENGIKSLKIKYQGKGNAGASTLISRANSQTPILEREPRSAKDGGPIDPVTGEKVWQLSGRTRIDKKTGERVPRPAQSTKLAEAKDAFSLSSGTPIEAIYAEHSNSLKSLANRARLETLKIAPLKRAPSAARIYESEVKSINAKLKLVERNAPLERQANIIAGTIIKAKRQAEPDMSKETLKKVRTQAINDARRRVGADSQKVTFTEREWEAIQNGAISSSKLSSLLAKADMDQVKGLATPRHDVLMTTRNVQRAQAMLDGGATRAEVALALGVSISTLDEGLK